MTRDLIEVDSAGGSERDQQAFHLVVSLVHASPSLLTPASSGVAARSSVCSDVTFLLVLATVRVGELTMFSPFAAHES